MKHDVRLLKKSPRYQITASSQKDFLRFEVFLSVYNLCQSKLLMIMSFDFLSEPHSAVPLYADECGSLSVLTFSTVCCFFIFQVSAHGA